MYPQFHYATRILSGMAIATVGGVFTVAVNMIGAIHLDWHCGGGDASGVAPKTGTAAMGGVSSTASTPNISATSIRTSVTPGFRGVMDTSQVFGLVPGATATDRMASATLYALPPFYL